MPKQNFKISQFALEQYGDAVELTYPKGTIGATHLLKIEKNGTITLAGSVHLVSKKFKVTGERNQIKINKGSY